ncbi:MAG: hypothetical protein U1G07_13600 [Verrucomicrobiota bacterium]
MRRFTQLLLLSAMSVGLARQVAAFSLTGPAAPWMTPRLGYNINPQVWPSGQGWGGGGPMNIGEEYRYNIPTLTYGFSPAFLDYFGQRGVEEVEKAVASMNALPSMDSININDFPLTSQRVNHQAEQLGLADVRSFALSSLVENFGLSDPSRWVFTLRNRWTDQISTNYYVIKRNFDPDTWQHSSFINGQLWTYTLVADVNDGSQSFVFTEPVDPLAEGGLLNAPVASGGTGNGLLLLGGYWSGLTRDDVGGFRYIYRHNNFNTEAAPTNTFGAGLGAVSSGGSSSPWSIPVIGTNTGGATIPGASTNFVNVGLRPGVGKITLVRHTSDSQLGPFDSNIVTYADTYVLNGREINQNLIRAFNAPDILFDAGDLQGGDGDQAFPIGAALAVPWPTLANGTQNYGPGTIPPADGPNPGWVFTLNSVGPAIYNIILNGVYFVSEINNFGRFFQWGSFDGSATNPLVYPLNTSIESLEAFVLGGGSSGGGGGGGGGAGSFVDTWTPSTIVLLPPGSLGNTTTTGGGTAGGTTP